MAATQHYAVQPSPKPRFDCANFNRTTLNGTDLGPGFLGVNPVGLLTYNPEGYMSASLGPTDPSYIPPLRDEPTHEDFALTGEHILTYAGGLKLAWENSTATAGRVIHGPLIVSSLRIWLNTEQWRDYRVTRKAKETGGKDVLQLYALGAETFSSLFWVRVP